MSDPSAQGHTNEARHTISEVENLRQDIKMLEAENARLREDPYAWYESAQRVNAELRERAEKAEAALDDIVTAWELPGAHCELIDAIAAARKLLPEEKQ